MLTVKYLRVSIWKNDKKEIYIVSVETELLSSQQIISLNQKLCEDLDSNSSAFILENTMAKHFLLKHRLIMSLHLKLL